MGKDKKGRNQGDMAGNKELKRRKVEGKEEVGNEGGVRRDKEDGRTD